MKKIRIWSSIAGWFFILTELISRIFISNIKIQLPLNIVLLIMAILAFTMPYRMQRLGKVPSDEVDSTSASESRKKIVILLLIAGIAIGLIAGVYFQFIR